MKTFLSIIIALTLMGCQYPPVSASTGNYTITRFSTNGQVEQTWQTRSFTESGIPSKVTFQAEGRTWVLEGSYQIDESK